MLNIGPKQACLCGSKQHYGACCGQFIDGNKKVENPEQLMRSRYSAYALKNENYLLQSWHESTRPDSLDLSNDSTQWKKLNIISTSANQVHFVAFFSQDSLNNNKITALSENSLFVKENNWFYLKGDEVEIFQLTKNMLCPCQSGKKYKRCCGNT